MIIEILGKQIKKAKSGGNYGSIKTLNGYMSVWDTGVYDKLPVSGKVDVIAVRNGNYWNITGLSAGVSINEVKAEDEKWIEIRREKTENINELNAKNNAMALLIAAYSKGDIQDYEVILSKLEEITKKIYETRIKDL